MKKQKTNKVKTVVYLIHFILIDIWARNGVLHIFPPGTYLFQFYTLFTVFKASPVKGFEGTGIPYSL